LTTQDSSAIAGADYTSSRTFAEMPISQEVLEGLQAMNFQVATPIQAASIEPALAGRDLLLRAKTGTGKTAAFGIPIVEKITAGEHKSRAIILAPTRELALQISQELAQIARFKDLRIAAIYGGVGFGPQEAALKEGAEIVVGTPGRLLDHIKRGNLKLGDIQFAVLDEADEMLSMGFLEDVRKILDRTPETRQTLLCSATLDESMKGLVARYLKNHEEIMLSSDGDNVSTVAHVLYESSPDYHKARALLDLLEQERPTAAIIFCNTKEDVQTVYSYLDRQGLRAELLTGDLPQNRRERVMAKIKSGQVQFLVSTDVAARGIDISDLTHVVNYALPEDPSVYLHRIGRTGRIGKTGTAISLAGGSDFSTRISLEKIHKINFDVRQFPSPEELVRLRTERVARMLKEASGSVAFESLVDVAKGLKEHPEADTILACALRIFFQWDRQRRGEPEESRKDTEERREEGRREEGRREEGRREEREGRREECRREERREERGRDRGRREEARRDEGRKDAEGRREERQREDRGHKDAEGRREERQREDRGHKDVEGCREERSGEDRQREDRGRKEEGQREKREDRGRKEEGRRSERHKEDRREGRGAHRKPEPQLREEQAAPVDAAEPIEESQAAVPDESKSEREVAVVDLEAAVSAEPTEDQVETDEPTEEPEENAGAGRRKRRRRRRRSPRPVNDQPSEG
jgi:ATP-dependent RNA helicase DeaD